MASTILRWRYSARPLSHLQLRLHYLFLIVYYLLDFLPRIEVLEIVVRAAVRYLLRIISSLPCKLAEVWVTLLVRWSLRRGRARPRPGVAVDFRVGNLLAVSLVWRL